MSMLSEAGIPAACETDIAGAVSMLALTLASKEPSAIADWNNNFAENRNKCVCTHCGNFPKSFIGNDNLRLGPLGVLGRTLGKINTFGSVYAKVSAGDFTFFVVGNIDLATAKPLIASYLGSLPSTGKQGKWVDHKMNIAKGQIVNEYAKEQQTPMATNFMLYSGTMDYTQRNLQLLNLLVSTLNIVYTEEIREKEGGTYGVSCMQSFNKLPQPEVMLQIVYQTDPAKKEHLNGLINQLFVKMSQEGPTAEQLDKARKVMLKRFTDNQKENSYWLNALYTSCYEQFDVTKDYESTLNSLTAADVAKLAADLLKQGNKITVIMTAPEEKK